MMKPIRTLFHALMLTTLATVLSNCAGAKFDRDWQAALAARSAAPAHTKADPISGPWQGTWLSHVNAHTGDLRCLVEPKPGTTAGQPGDYTFRYHATWGKIFQGGFDADFPVVKQGRRAYGVKGTKSLGLFGDFDHDGQIVGDTFEATYASEMGDHGVFEMKRP
ncbi:MAG: hypothetical protein JNK37_21100 [Verrucomicrobiales bacterium]|nr:hypothetical protein [Verrucomicrobiales bacterium]